MPFDPNDLSSIEPPKKKSSFNPDDLSIIGEKKKELSTPPAKPLPIGVATLSPIPTISQLGESDNGQQISFYNPSSFLGGEKKPTQQETQQLQPRTSTFREQMLKERQMFGQKPSDISTIVPKNENAEQEVKFKEIAYEREKKAITNTAKYNLSKRGITKPAEDDLQDEEKSLRNKLHNNELGVTKDKFGEPALSRPREWYNVIGHTFTESVTHPFTSYDVNKKVISKDYKGLVEDYNKEQAEQPFIPESYNKGGAIDYLSEMVGGLPMMMGVPLAGTIATGTPFGGAAAYGALDAWNKLKDDLYKNYADLKKQYPDAPEEALMERASDIAKNEAPINFVTGTAIGLSGNVAKGGGILAGLETRGATQTAKQALKQNLKGIAKEIGFVSGTMGTGSAAKEGVEYAGGVDKKLSDVAQHSIDAMGDGALMTVIFKLAHEGVALPKATKGAIKEYLATQPEYLVDGMLSEMGKVGEGIQKKLTAYRELRKQFEGVVPDEQIGVFTQWQEKVNGIKDEIKTLEKKKGLVGVNVEKIDKRIAEKNKQIAEVQNKLNHYSKTGTITETDNDTGATITTTTNLESSPYTIEGKKVSEQDFINAMEDKSLANKQWHIDENGDKDITNRAVKEFKGKYDEPTTTTRPETKVEEETKITPTENIERVGASNEPITTEEISPAKEVVGETVQPTEEIKVEPQPIEVSSNGDESQKALKAYPELKNTKVVNEDGTPKIVYHGGRDFDGFKIPESEVDKGIYFTDNPDFALYFAHQAELVERDKRGDDYSDIPNDLLESGEPFPEKYLKYAKVHKAYLDMKNPKIVDAIDAASIPKNYEKGKDGFIAKTTGDFGYEGGQYVVFDPNQIKNADIKEVEQSKPTEVKAEQPNVSESGKIKSSTESNIEALINPKTGLSVVSKKAVEQAKPFRDAYMERKGITMEDYSKLSDKEKSKIDEDWRSSKEYKDLEELQNSPKEPNISETKVDNPALSDVESTAKALEELHKKGENSLINSLHTIEELPSNVIPKAIKKLEQNIQNGVDVENSKAALQYIKDNFDKRHAEGGEYAGQTVYYRKNKSLVGKDFVVGDNVKILNPNSKDYELLDAKIIKEDNGKFTLKDKKGNLLEDYNKGDFSLDRDINKDISESYHKAKEDGSNPELVKAVEELLSKEQAIAKEQAPALRDVESTAKDVEPTSLRGVKYSDIVVGDKYLEDILSDNKLSEDEKQQVREIFARGVDYFKFDKEGEQKFQEKFSNPEDITDVADIIAGLSSAQESAFDFYNTKNYDNVKDAVNYIVSNPNDYSPKVVKAVNEIKQKLDNPSSSMNRLYAIDVIKELGLKPESLLSKEQAPASKEQIESTTKALEGKDVYNVAVILERASKLAELQKAKDEVAELSKPKSLLKTEQEKRYRDLKSAEKKLKRIESDIEVMTDKDYYSLSNAKSYPRVAAKNISEAYHKAKADGSNPELVKAVEELLGKPKEQEQANIGNQSINTETNALQVRPTTQEISRPITTGENITESSGGVRPSEQGETPTQESRTETNIKGEKEIGSIFDEALEKVYNVNENGEFKKADIMAENKFKSKYGEEGKKVIDIVKNFKKYAEQLGIEIKC
jgi:hypothetical protein